MPKPILKKATWLLLATVCLAAVIINSCKKDSRTDQQNSVTDPVIAQAKSWYESAFPVGNKLSTQAVSGDKDLNQVISPDWQHGDTYTKLSAAVIEMPLDPAHTLTSVLKDPAKNISYNNKNNSRSSFLVLKDSSGYHACIMTLIGDPAYLGNDPGKLAKSTYRKYDPAFSGLVLYFTPQGKYLNGYKYQNGHLIIPAQKQDSQSKLKVNEATALFSCTDYYVDTYVNDQVVGTHYAYTECIPVNLGGGGGGSPGGGGTAPGSNPGTGGSNPGTTTTPVPPITDPCAPKGGQPVVESAGKPSVQQVNPDPSVPVNPDGSFPPPADNTPCNTLKPATPITVSVSLPILDVSALSKYPKFQALASDLPNFLAKYPNITQALAYYTGFTTSDILQLMQPGKGPKVVTIPNLTDANGVGLYGHYDADTKTIQINENFAKGFEVAQSETTIQATALLLAITTLHEFVHYGRDQNKLSDLYQGYEAGWTFEMNIDPNKTGIDKNNAVKWINYYPYNFK